MKKKIFLLPINCFISLLIGAVIFVIFFGVTSLNPSNIDWISISHSDLRAHYLGWEFFRRSEWLFPLGVFNTLSYPVYTSVLNTDSLPFLAIVFKFLSDFLPKNFQYFGWFAISCYMMQSLFGMLIINKYVPKNIHGSILSILGGLLFSLVPVLWFPMWWHTILSCQWLILGAFLLIIYDGNLTSKHKFILYSALAFVASITQPYFLAYIGFILLAFCLYSFIAQKQIKNFLYYALFIIISLFTLYLVGAFSMNSNYSAPHLYEDSFNLNGFINSFGVFRFFSDMPIYSSSQQIGFAYWGIGVILLFFISMVCLFINTKTVSNLLNNLVKYKLEIVFVLLFVIFTVVLAISPRVTFGDKMLFEIPYPQKIIDLWSICRSTGRFIWITNYIVLILTTVYIAKSVKFKYSLSIFLICILFQIYDFIPAIQAKNFDMKKPIQYHSYLQNDLWNDIAKDNNIKVVYIDPLMYENSKYFDLDIAKWACENDLYLNDFDFSRPIKGLNEIYYNKLQNPNIQDMFIFDKSNYPKNLIQNSPLKYFYELDDLIIGCMIPFTGLDQVAISKNKL